MGRGGGFGFPAQRHNEAHYSAAPGFTLTAPSALTRDSSMPGGSFSTLVDPFQQPRTTASVLATQGMSLPNLSIPDNNLPDLYHPGPDAAEWASSASDSTYSTPVSDNARNPRYGLRQHQSPTSDWPPNAHLLAPYPNPTSRDPSRGGSLDSISSAPAPALFANPFQASHFSAVPPQDPNYGIMLNVPMAGFGTAEQSGGGDLISSPSPGLTFRLHHRHGTSLSRMQTAAPHTSGSLITSMPGMPDRTTVINTLSRRKEHLVNMTNSHETFMSGGVGFNLLGEFGGDFGDISPSGSGLLAALDLPMTGCGMPGIVLSSQQLPRQVLSAVPNYIEVYWQIFHKLYPIVHRPTFESSGEEVLRCAMAAVATQYLDTKEDRLRGNQLHEHAWQELKRVSDDVHSVHSMFSGMKMLTTVVADPTVEHPGHAGHSPLRVIRTVPRTEGGYEALEHVRISIFKGKFCSIFFVESRERCFFISCRPRTSGSGATSTFLSSTTTAPISCRPQSSRPCLTPCQTTPLRSDFFSARSQPVALRFIRLSSASQAT